MQYLGGKYRIRHWLATEVGKLRTSPRLWEPFAGGLNASEALLPDLCSDVDESLIALYQAMQVGWVPPTVVDAELYRYARTLPESNPLHGFCAFGCSFGGKKWGGYAKNRTERRYAEGTHNVLRRQLSKLRKTRFACLDFLAITPVPIDLDIYCDPPYAGTTGYKHPFDRDMFYLRIGQWAKFTTVLVSEYAMPQCVAVHVAECLRQSPTNRTAGKVEIRTERLFKVLPA